MPLRLPLPLPDIPVRAAILLLALCGCAARREDDGGERPGAVCDSDTDCNRDDAGTRSCGSLRLCVAGHCERGSGSQLLPCSRPDAGGR